MLSIGNTPDDGGSTSSAVPLSVLIRHNPPRPASSCPETKTQRPSALQVFARHPHLAAMNDRLNDRVCAFSAD
jgi:hypothetical protein